MMIPHHQGAIRMARVELAEGADAKSKQLATAIIDAQSREIKAMNTHRTETFGGPSLAWRRPRRNRREGRDDGRLDGVDGSQVNTGARSCRAAWRPALRTRGA